MYTEIPYINSSPVPACHGSFLIFTPPIPMWAAHPVSYKEQRGHILSLLSLILPDGEVGVHAVHAGCCIFPAIFAFKGSLARDFRLQIYFISVCTLWPSVSARSAGAYICNFVGGRAPPTLISLGKIFHHDGMYARKRLLPLCVYSVDLAKL